MVDVLGSGPPAGPVPRQLPAAPTGFVGRKAELHALDEIGSGLVIVTGTAGIGKTALVLRWGHRATESFPGGQLYVNLHGFSTSPPVKPLEALGLMLRALHVPAERVPVIEAEAAGLFRTLMAGRRTLVVLDNANSAEQVRPLLSGGGGALTVVTGRRNLSGLVAHDGALRLNLDVLEAGEAEALLVGVLGEERIAAERRAASELAKVCAHLPLALRVAAAHVSDSPSRRLADQVAALRGGDRLASLTIEGDERSAVRAAFDLSYQDIAEETRRTFRLLGLAPILDFSAPAVAALSGQPHDEAERQLGRLADAHLKERLGPDRYTFRQHGHFRHGLELATRAVHLGREFADACAECYGLVAVGGLRVQAGETAEAIGCHELALKVARAVGVRPPQVAALLGLAAARLARDETEEAFSLAEEALGLSRLAGFRLREGQALTLFASICHRAGEQKHAVELAREAAQVHRETGSWLGLAATLALLTQLGEQVDDISVLIRSSRIKPYDYATLTKGGTI